jgi:predicted O-methyltransferase YrrM
VLWRGRVAAQQYTDVFPGWTEAIREHNQLIFNDPDFDTFINPTRDGVIVARRKTVLAMLARKEKSTYFIGLSC